MSSASRKLRRAAKKQGLGTATAQRTQRRVHLAIVRDDGTGVESLKLQSPIFAEAWQNRIVEDTAQMTYARMKDQRSDESAAAIARAAMKSTSEHVAEILKLAPDGAVACRLGCSHCCYQRVGVTPPEALAILFYLESTRSPSELSSLKEKMRAAYEKTRDRSAHERLSPELPCPFLEDRMCSIYEVRPLSCRGVHSLEEQICEAKLHDEATRQAFFRGELKGHFYNEPIAAFHAVSAGMQLGLAEQFGLDMQPLELIAALTLLLFESPNGDGSAQLSAKPKTLREQWVLGKPAFASARAAAGLERSS